VGHDLAQFTGLGGARRGDSFVDERFHLRIGQARREVDLKDRLLLAFTVDEILSVPSLVRLSRFLSTLHLSGHHLEKLFVRDLPAKLDLAILDRRREQPESRETHLLTGLQRFLHLLGEPLLQIGHYNPSVLVWVFLSLVATAAIVAAYAIFLERRWYRLARYRLDILPAGEEDRLVVLHLSDLHMAPNDERLRRFLAALPAADIVVVTGDIVGEPTGVEFVVEALRPVRGRLASLFVLGSNDLYAPRPMNPLHYFVRRRRLPRWPRVRGRPKDLVRLLEADGWVHLKNRKYERPGTPVEIVGLDDPHIHRGDIRVAGRTAPANFGLAVVHSPDPAPELVALGYDLVLAGHTHGGQVRLPIVGAIVTNCSIPNRMARGLFRLGPGHLHVSAGLGTSKYAPFRLFCRPEATLLELTAGDDGSYGARARSKTAS
jgi:uncharacterized protein